MNKYLATPLLALSLAACGQPETRTVTTYQPTMSAEACNAWAADWTARANQIHANLNYYQHEINTDAIWHSAASAVANTILAEGYRISANCHQYGYNA